MANQLAGPGAMIDKDDEDHTVGATTAIEIVVMGDKYSLAETPSYDSKIVQGERHRLRDEMSIDQIASTLNGIKEYLLVAYYASMENGTLHYKAENMQLSIEKMCQECDVNMLKIKLQIRDTLHELQSGFEYVIEGFEEIGLKRLEDAAGIAKEVRTNAESLTGTITERINTIQGERLALKRCSDRDAVAEKMEGKEKEKTFQQQNIDARSREVSESQARIRRYENEEMSAVQAAKDCHQFDIGFRVGFKELISLEFNKSGKHCAEYQKQVAKEMREEQEKERKRLRQLKDEELKVRRDLDAFILKMNNDKPIELSEDAIQGAQFGLKNLESFAQAFSFFWEKNEVEFESIGNKGFVQQLTKLDDTRTQKQERKEFWKSDAFKREAMKFVARFVAILAMCEDFQKTLGKILNDIHFCIRENPTPEQAKERLTGLLADIEKNRDEGPKPGPST